MNETDIRKLIDGVKAGSVSRRSFVQKIVAAGLTAPIASQILKICHRLIG